MSGISNTAEMARAAVKSDTARRLRSNPETAAQVDELVNRYRDRVETLETYGSQDHSEAVVRAAIDELRKVDQGKEETKRLRVRGVDMSKVRPTAWTWTNRIPVGYLALLLGQEGMGKGVLQAHIAARITRGELPGIHQGKPAPVLMVGDEDSFDSVFFPRAIAAGADGDLLHLLDESDDTLDLREDADALAGTIDDGNYGLVLLDNLLDALGVDVDDWRAKQVRDALRPLRRILRQLDRSALASMHPNKGTRGSFRDLISGSFAFNAQSRSSLYLTQHPDDDDRRVLVRGKGNLSTAPPSYEFTIESAHPIINKHRFDVPVAADVAEGDLTIESLMRPDRAAPIRDHLIDEIDRLGTGQVQTRAEIARALGRKPDDRSVGRVLDELEADGRWIKEGRGKWRKVGIGIGVSKEPPMSTKPESELQAEGERLLAKHGQELGF